MAPRKKKEEITEENVLPMEPLETVETELLPGSDQSPENESPGETLPFYQTPEEPLTETAPPSASAGHQQRYHLSGNLSKQERQEWESIYASLRSRSVLRGEVIGIDSNYIQMQTESGVQDKKMFCAIIIAHRVKVIIPESEMWLPETEPQSHVFRNLMGATIDYVILDIDFENGCAVASRRMALVARQRYFWSAPRGHFAGEEQLMCDVLTVGPSQSLVSCSGFDFFLTARDMSYTAINDLRERYETGEELPCILSHYDPADKQIEISIKLATRNPFDGADQRHPVGSRRRGNITGKYNGGVFVALPDGLTVLCRYSELLQDMDFAVEDSVIVLIRKFIYDRQQIFGQIIAKR
jgi:hypothetical protein